MNPEDLLYIYELTGTVERPESFFRRDFVAHWREGDSTFLFFSAPPAEDLGSFLKHHPQLTWVRSHEITYGDWQAGGAPDHPRIGPLHLVPPGAEELAGEGEIPVIIDPGVVFGSGRHPTTRDSLRALLAVFQQDRPARVLDLGTGTGVLAIAAVKLGAREATAVDWNPACVANARTNVARNGLADRVRVEEGRAEDFLGTEADLLLANLHFAVVKELVAAPQFFQKPWAVVSGLLRSEARAIRESLQRPDFGLVGEWETEDTWFTLLGRKKESGHV